MDLIKTTTKDIATEDSEDNIEGTLTNINRRLDTLAEEMNSMKETKDIEETMKIQLRQVIKF